MNLIVPLLILGGAMLASAGRASDAVMPRGAAPPPNRTPPLRAAWTVLPKAATLELDPERQYCATIDLPAAAAALADAERLTDKLNERADWASLTVWDDPGSLPAGLPFPAADRVKQLGRYWVLGQPAKRQSIAASYLTRAFVRTAPRS